MAEISYNSIFDGLTLALHAAFPDAQIHGRTVEQDLHPGAFNVLPITPHHSGQMGIRAKRSLTFDVVYYATENGGREECLSIANTLPQVIGMITTPQGDKVHGSGFEINVEDDVLHCVVSYPHFVYDPSVNDAKETMAAMETTLF